jgi:hypothetical protein
MGKHDQLGPIQQLWVGQVRRLGLLGELLRKPIDWVNDTDVLGAKS